MTEQKNIMKRCYAIAAFLLLLAIVVGVRLSKLQWIEGEKYRKVAQEATIKNFTIAPNRGNLLAENGRLIASSVPLYDIRFDAVTVPDKIFEKEMPALADSISQYFKTPLAVSRKKLQKARDSKNRYLLIAQKLSYGEYIRFKNFPVFKHGPYSGGFIAEKQIGRELPLGNLAARTIGYDRVGQNNERDLLGIEGAYTQYLQGTEGNRLKQKIAPNQWKPLHDANEKDPVDGYDVVTTLDVTIQDIAHHALLDQLTHYQAEHGTVVVMETQTGGIKAISNLVRNSQGKYIEGFNYAIGESHEPGSTFKVMALLAGLEDGVIDTTDVVDTENGIVKFYGRSVKDSNRKGYGKINMAEATIHSSNTAYAKKITESYNVAPEKFIARLEKMHLNQKTGIALQGEGIPKIPRPDKKGWNGLSLPWMAFGYGVSLTPLQTLTFYNAIANNGVMVKPSFVKEVSAWDKTIKTFEPEILQPQIARIENIKKVQKILENTVQYGTAKELYNPHFSMAGKTGTCQTDYWTDSLSYISSFVGYFPASSPKFSVIVVIHKPDKKIGYYGADVAGPVFKKIAQKIYTQSIIAEPLIEKNTVPDTLKQNFEKYYQALRKDIKRMPDLTGMPGMDAVALLENEGYQTLVEGLGRVTKQSVNVGEVLHAKQKIKIWLE